MLRLDVLKNLSIRFKVILLSSIFTLALVVITAVSIFELQQLKKFSDNTLEVVDLTRETQVNFKIQVQEWKNILLRGTSSKQFDKYWGRIQKRYTDIDGNLEVIKSEFENAGLDTANIEQLRVDYKNMIEKYGSALKSYDQSDFSSAQKVDKLVSGIDRAPTKLMDGMVETYRQYANNQSTNEVQKVTAILLGTLAILATLAIAFSFLLRKNILNSIKSINSGIQALSDNDLTHSILVETHDELGESSGQLNSFIHKLGQQLEVIKQASISMQGSAQGLTERSTSMANFSNQQKDAITQIVAAVEETSSTIYEINELSQGAKSNVDIVSQETKNSDEAMNTLQTNSNKIVEVISVIEDISDQINLLALNAAIEAARAGEAGRGFAVVADEVRKLAANTSESTQRITTVIKDLQQNVGDTHESFSKISQSIDEVADSIMNVSHALEQQSTAIEEVSSTVHEFSSNMEEMTDNIQATSETAGSVETESNNVQTLLAHFKTK